MPLRNGALGCFRSIQPGAFLIFPVAHVLPPAKRAGKTRNLRRSRDSPPASALYVHDRVSGCVRDWSNHPGLEICCGCIPPSDNVAMDHTPHIPLPNPGPARSDREPEGTHQPGKMKDSAQSFSLSKLSKFPQNKKWAFRLIKQAKNPVLERLSGTAPPWWAEKDKEKSPQKWIIPPGV